MSEFRPLMANVEYLMRLRGIRNKDMVNRIGIGKTTFQNRKIKPEQFTLAEIGKIAEVLQVPVEELFKTHF